MKNMINQLIREKVYILIFFFFNDGFPKCVCKEKMEKITMYFTGTQILLILGISCIYEMDRRINNLFKKLFSKIYIFLRLFVSQKHSANLWPSAHLNLWRSKI